MSEKQNNALEKDEMLKSNPFRVPEGYFETFAGRLQQRIREEEAARVPVRRLRNPDRLRIAIAAAVIMLALVTYPLIRVITSNESRITDYPTLSLLENMDLSDADLYLLELMGNATVDEEEEYLEQAIQHLALNEVELDLITE